MKMNKNVAKVANWNKNENKNLNANKNFGNRKIRTCLTTDTRLDERLRKTRNHDQGREDFDQRRDLCK